MGRKGVLVVEGTKGAFGNAKDLEDREKEVQGLQDMMGFGGFGTSKKR